MIEVVPWFPNGDTIDTRARLFARHFLAGELDRQTLAMAWAALEDSRVFAITGIREQVDVPLFRSTCEPAARALARRVSAYLADRGIGAFLISLTDEAPEQRAASLAAWGTPEAAERVAFTVR